MKSFTAKIILAISALAPVFGNAQVNPETVLFEARLKQLYPSTTFKGIRTTPVSGIYEVQMGENITYIDSSGKYFFFGKLYDMLNQQDLTEARTQEMSKIDVSQFPLADAITTVRGTGERKLIVFSDPDCPFCKRLESSLRGLNDVTIYTFLYPLEQLHPDAKRKSVNIWCSPDRSKAWDAYMLENKESPNVSCPNPVEKTIALGNRLAISGTPTLFAMDGRKRAGAADSQSISKWLDAGKAVAK